MRTGADRQNVIAYTRRSVENRAKYNPARHTRYRLKFALLLLGDDLILDRGVDGGGNDFLLHQLVLALVGTVLDDGWRRGRRRRLSSARSSSSVAVLMSRSCVAAGFAAGLALLGFGHWRRAGRAWGSGLNRLRETGCHKSSGRA